MARLILLNGPPASGKSTLAARYANEHPLSLRLDVDVVRGLLGAALSDPAASGRLARQVGLAMARVVLDEGHDVIVAQFVAREEFIVALAELAEHSGGEFVEIVLTAAADQVVEWFAERSANPHDQTHLDAQQLMAQSGGEEELRSMVERWHQLIDRRAGIHKLEARAGTIELSYGELSQLLASIP